MKNSNSISKSSKRSKNKQKSKPTSNFNSADSKTRKRTIKSSNDTLTLKKRSTDTTILEADVEDFKYLIGKTHRDDEDLQRYVTERIYIDRNSGNIVGSRVLLLKDGRKHRSRDPYPIHVQDIVRMTNLYEEELSPSELNALVSSLLEGTMNEERVVPSNSIRESDLCLLGIMTDHDSLNTDNVAKILLPRIRGDELVDYCLQTSIGLDGILTPSTRRQALATPQKELWLEAEQKEIQSITTKKVLQEAQLPRGKKLLRTKWVYKIKYGTEGQLSSYKVRLVACGYSQIFGIDFDKTYSPVIRFTSLRLLFAISAQLGLMIHQMDVNTAFLHADINEEIYIAPPEGFPILE